MARFATIVRLIFVMADFKTHTAVAAAACGALSTAALSVGAATAEEALIFWLAGTLGGLLPDIDSDHSQSIQLVFSIMGAMFASSLVADQVGALPLWMLWLLGILAYLAVRYPVLAIFARFTVHRGMLHSLLANTLFAFITVALAHHYFFLSPRTSWGVGTFVFVGATIHLLLDELYSVDLSGARIKKSFGTALKITDWQYPGLTIVMALLVLVTFWISPSPAAWQSVLHQAVWQGPSHWPSLTDLHSLKAPAQPGLWEQASQHLTELLRWCRSLWS